MPREDAPGVVGAVTTATTGPEMGLGVGGTGAGWRVVGRGEWLGSVVLGGAGAGAGGTRGGGGGGGGEESVFAGL